MDNPGFLQSVVGKIGEFFQWLKEKMEDDQVRRDTLLDLGLNPDKEAKLNIPDESINNINQYQKSVNPDDAAFNSAVNDVKILYYHDNPWSYSFCEFYDHSDVAFSTGR